MATDPKVLLCDEATSALDPNTTRAILKLLRDINEKLGVTIVVITHEMQVVEQICNKVAVMEKGSVVESGPVQEVFLRPQSDVARNLILPKTRAVETVDGGQVFRLVFDGQSAYAPGAFQLDFGMQGAGEYFAGRYTEYPRKSIWTDGSAIAERFYCRGQSAGISDRTQNTI